MRDERIPGTIRCERSGLWHAGAAAVPAEVVQLVADVRHRKLVDDASLLGVDHGEEVGLLDAGAPVQASHVEDLLRRGACRLGGRGVKGVGVVGVVAHLHEASLALARTLSGGRIESARFDRLGERLVR
jgi:hypothetical protein